MNCHALQTRLRVWGAWSFVALALGYSPGALAQWDSNKAIVLSQTSGTAVTGSAGSSKLWNTVIGRTIEVNGGTGYVKLKEPGSANMGPGPRVGTTIPVAVERGIAWSAAMRTVARSLPLISTALAIKELMDGIRCRESSAGAGAGECDAGTVETSQTVTQYNNPFHTSAPFYASAAASCTDLAGHRAAQTGTQVVSSSVPEGGGTCTWTQFAPAPCVSGCTAYGLNAGTVSPVSTTVTQCPPITVGGVTTVPVKGLDNKCPTGTYAPADEDTITTKGTNYGDKTKGALIVGDLIAAGKPVPHDPPVYDAPPSQVGTRETTTHPDGSTTVRDRDWIITDTPDGYTWEPRLREKTYAPGDTIPPQGSELPGGTTTTGAPPSEEIITCGLPNTPPCKIDETGTPTAPANTSTADANGIFAGILTCVTTPSSCLPALPDMNWSFSLPTSCAPIPLSGFEAYSVNSVDICPYQTTIHDLMSLLWAAAGLFGAVSIIFKGSE